MATTGTNKATDGGKDNAVRTNNNNGSEKDSKGGNNQSNASVQSEEEKEEQEESKRQENALSYGNKVNKNYTDKNDHTLIESDADMESASWLIVNGYAEMHATQEGLETYNYILLTEDGLRALSSYNEEKTT